MRKSTDNNEELSLNIVGDLVGLGPLRRDLNLTYQRWINDFGTLQTLNVAPRPTTCEQELSWYERQSKSESTVHFTIYKVEDLTPTGTTTLTSIDLRNGTANFAAIIGEVSYRGKGCGTEALRLTLDWAFITLGLRNILVRIVEFNEASRRAHKKAGFCEFGRRRECRIVGGRRWDEIQMECLSSEFESPVLAKFLAMKGEGRT